MPIYNGIEVFELKLRLNLPFDLIHINIEWNLSIILSHIKITLYQVFNANLATEEIGRVLWGWTSKAPRSWPSLMLQ